MDQAKNLQLIKRWVEGWPRNQKEVLDLMLKWPDELRIQDRIVAFQIKRATGHIKKDRWHTSAVSQSFLEGLCRGFASGMRKGDIRPKDVPPNLLIWALEVAGGTITKPTGKVGRSYANVLRDLKILSVTSALQEQLGINQEDAKALIAEAVDGLTEDRVHEALRRARAQERSRLGIVVLNMLEIKYLEEKFN